MILWIDQLCFQTKYVMGTEELHYPKEDKQNMII